MSKFKVGDWVRRISNGEQRQVSDIDMSHGRFYSSAEKLWYFQHDFELVSPQQPAESPNDWVTQDVVRARPGIDQRAYQYDTTPEAGLQWDRAGQMNWEPMPMHGERGNGVTVHLRCRRRDYPQKPVDVHTGGPYVARSVHEQICSKLTAEVIRWQGKEREACDRAEARGNGLLRTESLLREARERLEYEKSVVSEVNKARGKATCDLNAVRATLEKRDAEVANLRHEQSVLLADLKNFEETTAALNNQVLGGNPNGWPLVPVDPSCIPDGHRAVEVTKNTQGKLVASLDGLPRKFINNEKYARLVVEPIPTPQAPDALPRPEFPAWIRAGWWVAMDLNKDWYAYESEPTMYDTNHNDGKDCLDLTEHLTPSMISTPANRWREAKWQVE